MTMKMILPTWWTTTTLFFCQKNLLIIAEFNRWFPTISVGKLYFYWILKDVFSSFGFWYFGHFSCVIFFPLFSVLPILPCKQRLHNIFIIFETLLPKGTKYKNKKWNERNINVKYVTSLISLVWKWWVQPVWSTYI